LTYTCKSKCSGASPKLGFKILVTSLLLITIHIIKQIMDTNNITPNMETNYTIIYILSVSTRSYVREPLNSELKRRTYG
jgi:hypothetical protein